MVDKFIQGRSLGFDISCAFKDEQKQTKHGSEEAIRWSEYADIDQ